MAEMIYLLGWLYPFFESPHESAGPTEQEPNAR